MKITLDVIYEDNHLLVVNKPASVLVQGDQTGDMPLVEIGKQYLKEKYNKPGNVFLGVVHRLDRPVSGLVVLAKTSKALTRMNRMFQEREVEKIYWAIVSSRPKQEEETITHWLQKDKEKNKTHVYLKNKDGAKKASLHYKLIKEVESGYLLEVIPYTGRPHQIRAQLAKIGCSIKGDLKYGASSANQDSNIALHAKKLSFVHPVKKTSLKFEAPLPSHLYWK